ncbi:MAG: hypothetical protein ABWZ52_04675 [Acidimicrobiales bacterium]
MAEPRFWGRDDLLGTVREASGESGVAFELAGPSGVGKTSIVGKLKVDAEQFRRRIPVDLEDYNPEHPGERGDQASVGAVQASFQKYCALLKHLVEQTCTTEVVETFAGEITEAYNSEVANKRVFSLELAMKEVDKTLGPGALARAWQDSANAVADRFVEHWNVASHWQEPVGPRGRLLMLDNVDLVADQKLGEWLSALLPRLEQTVVLLTRRPDASIPSVAAGMGERVQTLTVENFNEAEVFQYLNLVNPGSVKRDMAERVHNITGGHPGTISIVYELLWGRNDDDTARVETLLTKMQARPDDQIAFLVEEHLAKEGGAENPMLLSALKAATVPRQFDVDLLTALLDGVSTDDGASMFKALRGFPFVEDVTPPGEDELVLRIHSYVRDELLRWMIGYYKSDFYGMHGRAADFHHENVSDESSGYGEAFVYEDPAWQRQKREWLYHRAHAKQDKEALRQTALECSQVFLEAFWWWGNYVHFDFCDQLVADLRHLVTRTGLPGTAKSSLDGLYQALQRLLQSYPLRSSKQDGNWSEVTKALRDIQTACGLARGTADTEQERKVEALLQIFRAHTWRYGHPGEPKADKCYETADSLLDSLGARGAWDRAWVQFERADLRRDQGQLDERLEQLWRAAAAYVQPDEEPEEPDHELAANLHRLRGDVCWDLADHRRASMWYRRAVLHAYLFHLSGGPPDEYTLQFYVDIRARAITRLLDLRKDGKDEDALQFAIELAGVHADTMAMPPDPTELEQHVREQLLEVEVPEVKLLDLANTLFPAGPEVGDLGKESGTTFLEDFMSRQEEVNEIGTSGTDLHDAQWP